MEDEPNSPDLQKGSLSGGDGHVSPSAGHRCDSRKVFYRFPENI